MASSGNIDIAKTTVENARIEMVAKYFPQGIQLPDPPYTPMIKGIRIIADFKEEIIYGSIIALDAYNKFPYGIKRITSSAGVIALVPSFPVGGVDATESEGELYIGFKNIKPAQSLNVLIAVEEGSADPGLQNPKVTWTYLLNDEWTDFDVSAFYDGTKGLIQSGLLQMMLPETDVTNNQLLPGGYLWIKAAVPFNQSDAVSRIISIHTQAVAAAFDDHGNDPSYLGTNIPANTITNLSPKLSAVKKVTQPLPSSGGRKNEEPEHLYTRISERLRHKVRGINAWDYENIILEAFPEIYKVKVLQHACPYKSAQGSVEKIISKAGSVVILVVKQTHALTSAYKPLVSKATLTAIYEFMRQLVSSFAKITVMNPLFEEVAVGGDVVFQSFVKDRGFYEDKLREDVKRFLSPWAYEDGREPEFDGAVYNAAVVNFIEELPYVDYVQSLSLSHVNAVSGGDMVKASSPASMLITASSHNITGHLSDASITNSNTNTIAFC